jgi:hypothetical protein
VTPGVTTVTGRGDLIGVARLGAPGISVALLTLNGVGHATGHDDLANHPPVGRLPCNWRRRI